MKLADLAERLDLKVYAAGAGLGREVAGGYAGDNFRGRGVGGGRRGAGGRGRKVPYFVMTRIFGRDLRDIIKAVESGTWEGWEGEGSRVKVFKFHTSNFTLHISYGASLHPYKSFLHF